VIVLLFLLHPPGAYLREARGLFAPAAQLCMWKRAIEESSLEVCEFLEAGAFTQQIVQAFQTGSCKNYQLAQTRTLYCIAQEWPSGHSPLGLC